MTVITSHYPEPPLSVPHPLASRDDQRLCVWQDYKDGVTSARSALEAVKNLNLYLHPKEEDPGWNEFLRRLQEQARREAAEEYGRRG